MRETLHKQGNSSALAGDRCSHCYLSTIMQTRRSSSDDDILPPSEVKDTSAHWTTREESELINFLLELNGQMDPNSTFNDRDFSQAADAIAQYHEKGAIKTGKLCKSKWRRVCLSDLCLWYLRDAD